MVVVPCFYSIYWSDTNYRGFNNFELGILAAIPEKCYTVEGQHSASSGELQSLLSSHGFDCRQFSDLVNCHTRPKFGWIRFLYTNHLEANQMSKITW